MSPCNCGGRSSTGAPAVWTFLEPGQPARQFASQTEAEIARTRAGGKGAIVKTFQPARR